MPARAKSAPRSSRASAKAGASPPGRVMVTGSGKAPVVSASSRPWRRGRAGAGGPAATQFGASRWAIGFAFHVAILATLSAGFCWLAKLRRDSLEFGHGQVALSAAVLEPGWVWLAGAGPGDPGLLTLTTLEGLRGADVVVYDALVGEDPCLSPVPAR